MSNVGKKVRVHYKGTLNDGSVFDSSEGREPLEFEVGSGQMIQGFDLAVMEMELGETKQVNITADQAYGPVQENLIKDFPRSSVPDSINPQKGMPIQLQSSQGPLPAIIMDVTDEHVTVNANHPLAGQDLNFEINLTEIL